MLNLLIIAGSLNLVTIIYNLIRTRIDERSITREEENEPILFI